MLDRSRTNGQGCDLDRSSGGIFRERQENAAGHGFRFRFAVFLVFGHRARVRDSFAWSVAVRPSRRDLWSSIDGERNRKSLICYCLRELGFDVCFPRFNGDVSLLLLLVPTAFFPLFFNIFNQLSAFIVYIVCLTYLDFQNAYKRRGEPLSAMRRTTRDFSISFLEMDFVPVSNCRSTVGMLLFFCFKRVWLEGWSFRSSLKLLWFCFQLFQRITCYWSFVNFCFP